MHCRPARQKTFQNRFTHMDTVHPMQTPNLYLTLTFLNKNSYYYFFMIFNYQVLIESRKRKPCFSESSVTYFVLHFTLIFGSCIF